MIEFPENLELLDFFAAEPTLSDPGVPWAYNRLEFINDLGEDRVECVIDNPELEIRWFRQEVEQTYLKLFPVQSLRIQEFPGGKILVAEGIAPEREWSLRLQLRPQVHLAIQVSQ